MSKHTPIEVKKLKGTFRDDRHLPYHAQLPTVENIPMPPPTLNEKAHYVWYSQVAAMQKMRILTEADYILLELFCEEKYIYDKAVKALRSEDLIDETNNGLTKMVNLHVRIKNDAIKNMIDLSKKLGFSPLDRSGIGVNNSIPNDPLAGIIKK